MKRNKDIIRLPSIVPDKIVIKMCHTISLSKDNKAARRRLRRRIADTLRKPTTKPTQLAEESEMVSDAL